MKPLELSSNVDIDNVAGQQGFAAIWNPVAYDLVSAGANGRRETLVPELTRFSAARARIGAHQGVDFRGRHARAELSGHASQRCGRHRAGSSHSMALGLVKDCDLHALKRGVGELAVSNTETVWGVAVRFVLTYRRMSLAQLKYFVAVAEEGNIGRAAQRLHISQPPLSRQLRSLEDELGAALFERTPRGVRLLPNGELFLSHAKQILSAVELAVASVSSKSSNDSSDPGPSLVSHR